MLLHGFWVISTNETELVCQIAMLQLLFYWTIKITHMVADIKYNLIANWIQKKVNGVSLMDYFPESIVFLNGSQGKSCWVYSSFGKNVKEDPYKYQFFKKKVTHSYTNRFNFGPNFEQNHQIFPTFS